MSTRKSIFTRTVVGCQIDLSIRSGLPYNPAPFTTVTEAINENTIVPFQPTVGTAGMEYADAYDPVADTNAFQSVWFCIGNKGHTIVVGGTNSVPYNDIIPHRSRDTGLYGLIPHAVRPIDDDFTPSQRENLRGRKVIEVGGSLFAAYYLKRLDTTDSVVSAQLKTVSGGVATLTAHTPTINDMRPTPPPINASSAGTSLIANVQMVYSYTPAEADQLAEACDLLFNDPNTAIISEIGVVQAVDKPITTRYPVTGTQIAQSVSNTGLFELVCPTITAFIGRYIPVDSEGMSGVVTSSTAEPLYGPNV